MDTVAAHGHEDAEEGDKDAADRHGIARRTACDWRTKGPPPVRHFQTYLWNSPTPYRLLAQVKVVAKARTMDELETKGAEGLIERYHEIRRLEKMAAAEESLAESDPKETWLNRCRASTRVAALNEEKAAIEFQFAERRISWDEVWGR